MSPCLTPPGVNFRDRTHLQKNTTFTVLHDMGEPRKLQCHRKTFYGNRETLKWIHDNTQKACKICLQ